MTCCSERYAVMRCIEMLRDLEPCILDSSLVMV